ncbi:hypothetical protein [Desulfovibrio sp. UCD-KL4C]|uniref:hypothetical protein n=1 Tax=Desulfovibrio sp. UCD-KL4C TaxID=2578120 RepID=UPI0025B7F167|nr:hypothetical protein [Desulfovibrio sp. UCD-KL4C]
MTPDSPDKQAKEEVLDLNDIAEEIVTDDASGVHDVDTSFEQELEDLFSEDLELEEPAVGDIEESSEDDDLLVLDDVVEEVSDDELLELDDAMILDDVVEEVSDDDLLELDDAMILDDVVEEVSDDAMVLDEAMILDDVVEDDEDVVLDDVLDEAEKLESADSDSDTDTMLENFDLGEESLMAAEAESAEGEVDAEGLDHVIDELGGDSTVAADDKDDIDNLFDGDTDVAALDQLLDDSDADSDIDELNDLLGDVSEDVDLSELGEDILADEDIESLLSDDEDLLEISEEGLDPLEVDEPEAASEQVEPVKVPEAVEPAETPEVVEAEIAETLEVELSGTTEGLETPDVSEQSEEILENVVLDDDLNSITEEPAGPDVSPAVDSADIDTDTDDSELNELDDSDASQLDDDDIDLGELLEDVEIDLSDLDEEDLMPADEFGSADSGPLVTVEAVNELADRIDSFDSEFTKLKDLIDSTAAGYKDANLEEKVVLAEKRAEDLEVALAESSERIIALEEKVAQINSLEDTVSSLMASVQGLEERLSSGEIDSVVGQKLSETLKADSPAVIAVAAIAADEIQERVEEWVQTGMLEIKAEVAEKVTALEEKLNAAPDMAELVSNELEKELDPESTAFYRIKSRLTEDIEDYLTPRLIEKIEEMKGDVEDNFKSTIDEILAEKLERSVPAEAARIIREEIAALARDFDE